jgi:uncharacterized damage-inducible protein DinB
MMRPLRPLALALALALSPAAALAHDASAPAAPGIRAEVIASIDDAANKLVALAEAMPEAKYGWAPGKDVRTVAQVYAHVIGGNYMIPTFIGMTVPEGLGDLRGLEKSPPAKAKMIEMLRASFDFAKSAVQKTSDAELGQAVKLFGSMEGTKTTVLLLLATHAHEHLGQSIAYARSNGVTPPWTAHQQAEAAKAKPDKN